MFMIRKFLLLLVAVLTVRLLAAQSQGVQDSLLLENAFRNKESQLVEDLLNRWSQDDVAVKDIKPTDTASVSDSSSVISMLSRTGNRFSVLI